jgi:hypothetical protein
MVCIDHVARRVIQLGMNANGWISGHIGGGWESYFHLYIVIYLRVSLFFFFVQSHRPRLLLALWDKTKGETRKFFPFFPVWSSGQ